jgi:peptide/nickel transport system ATP-binding protein
MSTALLDVGGLAVAGPKGLIVTDVSFQVGHGRTLAVVGESGSGKSVTTRAVLGLLSPGLSARGSVAVDGTTITLGSNRVDWGSVRGSRMGLIPQDPFTSLSPRHTCGFQVGHALSGLRRAERRDRTRSALEEVGLPARVADQYPFQISGGMRQRVAIAAALITDPLVLIADEPTTALDVTTQHEILDLLQRLQDMRGMGLVLVTHDLGVARARSDQIAVMYAGRIIEHGAADTVLREPEHPYTVGLQACEPPVSRRLSSLPVIPGSVPRLADVADRCGFVARCPVVRAECSQTPPELRRDERTGRAVACFAPGAADPAAFGMDAAEPVATRVRGAVSLVAVRGVSRAFGGVTVLDDIDLDVMQGEVVGIVGESGSGKSTLARLVAGLEEPDRGFVQLDAAPTKGSASPVQIVFQDPYSSLNPSRRIGSQLNAALSASGTPSDRNRLHELLRLVGLPDEYASRRPRSLSGGERQRVAIARAIAAKPRLLICDEPVSALDVSVQAQVLNLLAGLHRSLDLGMLFISHDLGVVRQLADRIYVMRNGRCVEHGTASEIFERPKSEYTRRLLESVPAG